MRKTTNFVWFSFKVQSVNAYTWYEVFFVKQNWPVIRLALYKSSFCRTDPLYYLDRSTPNPVHTGNLWFFCTSWFQRVLAWNLEGWTTCLSSIFFRNAETVTHTHRKDRERTVVGRTLFCSCLLPSILPYYTDIPFLSETNTLSSFCTENLANP